jgi:hypothetical protein
LDPSEKGGNRRRQTCVKFAEMKGQHSLAFTGGGGGGHIIIVFGLFAFVPS